MSDFDAKKSVHQVADGLYRIDTMLGPRVVSIYVVAGSNGAFMFDTGVIGTIPQYVLPALSHIGVDPEAIKTVLISHADVDHFGGIADARHAFPNVAIVAHAADRPLIEDYPTFLSQRGLGFLDKYGWDEDPAVMDWVRSVTGEGPLDADVVDGQVFDLGDRSVTVWHVPGHSHGHTAVVVPAADAVLVSDAVLAGSVNLPDGTPVFAPTYRYVDEYLATISRLESANHELLLTAHYPTMRGDEARAFLAESRDFVERLDALLWDALPTEEGVSLHELLETLNPVAGPWPNEGTASTLAYPVVGHLERFEAAGTVVQRGTDSNGRSLWGRQ